MVRLWLDDVRPMPYRFDMWCKTAVEAVILLQSNSVEHISFDHDLGGEYTGYDVAKTIENMAFYGTIQPLTWSIHTANPVGRDNIRAAMKSAERFWLNDENNLQRVS